MSVLSLTNPPGWSVCSALWMLIVLLPEAKANRNTTTQHNGGGTQCGEYTNQVITVDITVNMHDTAKEYMKEHFNMPEPENPIKSSSSNR